MKIYKFIAKQGLQLCIYFICKGLSINTKAMFDTQTKKVALKCLGTLKMQFWHIIVKMTHIPNVCLEPCQTNSVVALQIVKESS